MTKYLAPPADIPDEVLVARPGGRMAAESRAAWHLAIGPKEVYELALKVLDEAMDTCNPALVKLILQQAVGDPKAEDLLEELQHVRGLIEGTKEPLGGPGPG